MFPSVPPDSWEAREVQETPRVKALVRGGIKPHTQGVSGALQNFNPARSKLHPRAGGHTGIPKGHPTGNQVMRN